ncbi:hypothetical protein K1T71_014899 [Dendrolimus kikuchii]|nr:hypothetical protein K1T71_014899 [Dendrolimus kikuchii]
MSKTRTHSLPQRSSCINDHSTLCHICNMMVPKSFIFKHMKSSFHINNVQIIDNILERSKHCIKVETKYETKSHVEYDEFCDVCTVSHSHVQKLNHKSSDQHRKLIVYAKILPKICILFKDFANNLNVIGEMKEILNEKELTLSNGNSSEDIITSNNVSKEIYQNLKDSYSDDIVLDNDEHDDKDTLTFEVSNVRMRTRRNKVKDSKPNKLAEEIANINNKIFIQKTTETVNELNKINPNESVVETRPADIIYCQICDTHITFKRSNYMARNKSKQLNVPQQASKSKQGLEFQKAI